VNELLNHPAVQGGVAPFVAALVVVLVFGRVRLGGLAVLAGFVTAAYLVSGIAFTPLTATRKIVLLALTSPVVGMLADFAFRPTRAGTAILALLAAAAALWVFWPVLAQKETAQALLLGANAALLAAWLVAFALGALAERPLQAGAAGLGLGVAVGGCAILGASAVYGSYGISLAAASGAFLLPQLISGRKIAAGATFVLPVSLAAALLAGGTAILAQLPWYVLPVLGLIPAATCLPAPEKAWARAITASAYALAVAALALALAWQASRGAV
jgi:hypothetical protein